MSLQHALRWTSILGFGAQQRLLWKAPKTGSSTAICGRRLGQRRIEHWRLNPATFSPLLQPSITISCADSKRPEAIPISQKDLKGDYRGLGFVARSYEALDSIECESLTRSMSDAECRYLEEISTHCAERSIQLILINPPQLCEETFDMPPCFDGLAYIDGNAWPGAKTPRNFYDDHHLVEAGALSYSAWLAEQIASLLHAS